MSRNIYAQPTQLLNQPPNFGPRSAQLFGNFRPTDHNRSVTHEQAHDAAEANVGRFVNGRQAAGFGGGCDAGIINSRWSLVVGNQAADDGKARTTTTND